MDGAIEKLLNSDEPAIRYKMNVNILGLNQDSSKAKKLSREIKNSERVKALLSFRDKKGEIPKHPYSKWHGSHWTLSMLAELEYPPGDKSLIPMREQALDWLFSEEYESRIETIDGKVRWHTSMEGNALYYLQKLGISDKRIDKLVDRLLAWQWQDGGWNCRTKETKISSFHETLYPVRGLALYARLKKSRKVESAVKKAAEIFLKRRMFKRLTDGTIIKPDFVKLHYPRYWHYDLLGGLLAMAEAGLIKDKRCEEGLDLLESKRTPDGGFPAQASYYKKPGQAATSVTIVDWGGVSSKKMNEFVTADALYVLKLANRLKV